VGIGTAPDQEDYGDAGSDTLGNVARAVGGLALPNLDALGLGCCRPLEGLGCSGAAAATGVALPASHGKDSTTGHWELCGVLLERPFPTYPEGFPDEVVEAFAGLAGRGILANAVGSGTAMIDAYGQEHLETGNLIVYTSADSVFQVAAHEDVVPIEELYRLCELARTQVLVGDHAVSRVIARPFVGESGTFRRTVRRRDFSVAPTGTTLLDRLAAAGVDRVGVGKVDDLFAGRGIQSTHPASNAEAYEAIEAGLASMDDGFLFANVIEFDQSWGHRNDVEGFYSGLRELDRWVPSLVDGLRDEDLVILTADHGNDPTTPSTDHSREAVPIVAVGPRVVPVALGERSTFADIGATVADYFGCGWEAGRSFLPEVAPWMR
jgi:phosphopentomutase